jgi:uncharacterized membrane protein
MNDELTTPISSRHTGVLHWLVLAGWVLIALLLTGLFWVDVVVDYSELQVPCAGEPGVFADCNFAAITPAEVAVLTSWGLTMQAYAMTMASGIIFTFLVYLALAGLILWRQGSSWLGLTVSLALVIIPFAINSGSRDFGAINPVLFWPGLVASILGTAIMLVFLYLAPNGRFSPRWAYIPLIGTLLLVSVLNLEVNELVSLSAPALSLVSITIISLVLFGGSLQIYRYLRDSNAVERQQTKWIIFAIVIFVSSIMAWVLVFGGALTIPPGRPRLLANLGGAIFIDFLALPLLPATITIAILRYKLWGIDVIIRKTLVYLLLSGLLALVYFGIVILLQSVFNFASSQQSSVVIVISTLAIAALFSPLRKRIQDFIDRRFYRQKYNAEQALAEFTTVAQAETNLEVLIEKLSSIVLETLQPETIGIWIRQAEETGS